MAKNDGHRLCKWSPRSVGYKSLDWQHFKPWHCTSCLAGSPLFRFLHLSHLRAIHLFSRAPSLRKRASAREERDDSGGFLYVNLLFKWACCEKTGLTASYGSSLTFIITIFYTSSPCDINGIWKKRESTSKCPCFYAASHLLKTFSAQAHMLCFCIWPENPRGHTPSASSPVFDTDIGCQEQIRSKKCLMDCCILFYYIIAGENFASSSGSFKRNISYNTGKKMLPETILFYFAAARDAVFASNFLRDCTRCYNNSRTYVFLQNTNMVCKVALLYAQI